MAFNDANGTTPTPSRVSVRALVALACLLSLTTFAIPLQGDRFDGRHLVGFLLGLVATAAVACQAARRSADRRAALRAQYRWRVTDTGTWFRGDGAEIYAAVVPDEFGRRVYFLGGQLPPGVVQEGAYSRAQARNVLLSMESGEWSPLDDSGTRRIRSLLALSGWREDQQVVAQTTVQRGYRS